MIILGISCFFHDAAACILKDGVLIAAAEEERFTRKKHDKGFPENAIKYCLQETGVSINEVDYVGFYEKPLIKLERLLYQQLECFPKSFVTFFKSMPEFMNNKLRLPSLLKKKFKYKGKVIFSQHHMSHAASSYLVSSFKESAILTVDGVGEWATTTYGFGKENKIELFKEIKFPHSLGLLYSTITAYLGFSVNNSEYKVMGLTPYGDPKYVEKFRQMVEVADDGSYKMNMEYFTYHYMDKMPSEKLCELFGGPVRKSEGDPLTQRHKDIAASLQVFLEETMVKMLNYLHKETKSDNLCMAGGVALNSVFNGKIFDKTPFKNVFIQPAAGDSGGAVGVAFYIYNCVLGNERKYVWHKNYLGPGYSTDEIKKYLDSNGIVYTKFKSDSELIKKTAKLLLDDNVVGWFQGRMEWGPRALGSRSILSNASNPDMKEILNSKVKHREQFRPFAPVVTCEDAKNYFEFPKGVNEEPYMLFVYPIKKEWHKKIPSVTHVDGSGRVQTITKEQNKLYHGVIKEFGNLTGIPILINTSFNIRGEPIVCNYKDAYKCMMGTGIDYLVLDRFLIKRSENPKDMWDSEGLAKD